MKKILPVLVFLLMTWNASAQKPEFIPGELIVQLRDGGSMDPVIQDNFFLNGKETGLEYGQYLSPPMRAHLLRFDPDIDHNAMLRQVFSHPSVTAIQFNHVIAFRDTVIPDDAQFGQQWQHYNTGANNGTAGSDVSSTIAWDITTGGVTAMGDTIVICIVDDGIRYDHPDLVDNLWINYGEIPDNGIDDDGNGYVDDIYGWNAANNTPNVGSGSHGVSVAGMAGASGNNGIGVAGVNWNVKLMSVRNGGIGSGNNPNEANVIAAYTYPLIMRQLYEQTGGEKGAFVVATNSSWGINNGNPANAPLWCAFYDTLGAYGILSAGATANAQINVDVNGDLPTGCTSSYLLSVTATNNNDVRTFSGYGATTIHLGAPGEAVRTTSGNSGYTTTDGTSFASPMVAGAIALMYSAPCASLAAIAHAEPSLAAQMVRQYILGGVDVVTDLVGYTTTGGRLNLHGALMQLLNDCQDAGCIRALAVNVGDVTDTSAVIGWTGLDDVLAFDVRYGEVGGTDTITLTDTIAPLFISNLKACTDYWYSILAKCEEDSSAWGSDRIFRTDGCCEPPVTLTVGGITETSAVLDWNAVLAANSYLLQWREQGTDDWSETNVTATDTVLGDLTGCIRYEVRIATVCDTGITDFELFPLFRTLGCGDCTDIQYCDSEGDSGSEWIASVIIGDFVNGSNGAGYQDFTDLEPLQMHRGTAYDVAFSPGFSAGAFREHFRVWVDLNRDGVFTDATELLFDDTQGSQTTVTGTLTIPMNAALGSARMRVSMAYGAQFFGDYPQSACEMGHDGEVEDYCIEIMEELPIDTTSVREVAASGIFGLTLFPVPTAGLLHVRINDPASLNGSATIRIIDMQGRSVSTFTAVGERTAIDVSTFDAGIYLLEMVAGEALIGRGRFIRN
jgi:serine protease